jgi:ABC-type multidrug transport system fused ATPase/permease subunit
MSLQLMGGVVFTIGIVVTYTRDSGGDLGGLLLVAFLATSLPAMIEEMSRLWPTYAVSRRSSGWLCDLLQAGDEIATRAEACDPDTSPARRAGISIELERVWVKPNAEPILRGVTVSIPAGAHVAVVGPTGAGKSTLAGLLLGLGRPDRGELRVDGQPMCPDLCSLLRRETAWVAPDVKIWDRPLLENLEYGATREPAVDPSLARDLLHDVIRSLPTADTSLGDDGVLLSAGHRQLVRFARAVAGRPEARLVVLDEPFRGMSRSHRRELMALARRHWAGATLIAATHDVADTGEFDQVVVLERGRVVEVGAPLTLAEQPTSRYRAMLIAEEIANQWRCAAGVRSFRVESGSLASD